MKAISIVIPAYNESGTINEVCKELVAVMEENEFVYEIIIVDDCSTDDTIDNIYSHESIHAVRHETNRGYGAALKTGIQRATFEDILIIDADGSYPVSQIPNLLEHVEQNEMVVGARLGSNVKIPLIRKPAKWFLGKLANFLTKTTIPDINSGLRTFKKQTVQKFFNILPSGFSFTTTITLAYLNRDYPVKYVPIDYYKRGGKSKINPFKDFINFISLIIKTSVYFAPLRVFIPISMGLLSSAVILFLYSWLMIGKIMDVTIIVLTVSSLQVALFGLLADLVDKRTGDL